MQKHSNHDPWDNAGFSLLEIVVGVGIFSLLVGSIVAVFLSSYSARTTVFDSLAAQSQGRRFLQAILAEARSATFSNTGGYPIEKATAGEFIFYANIDTDTLRERVRYFYATTTLKKGVVKPSGNPPVYNLASEVVTEVVPNVGNGTSSLFLFYDQAFTGAESPLSYPVDVTKIRAVGISLKIKKNSSSTDAITIESTTAIRNLKTN